MKNWTLLLCGNRQLCKGQEIARLDYICFELFCVPGSQHMSTLDEQLHTEQSSTGTVILQFKAGIQWSTKASLTHSERDPQTPPRYKINHRHLGQLQDSTAWTAERCHLISNSGNKLPLILHIHDRYSTHSSSSVFRQPLFSLVKLHSRGLLSL